MGGRGVGGFTEPAALFKAALGGALGQQAQPPPPAAPRQGNAAPPPPSLLQRAIAPPPKKKPVGRHPWAGRQKDLDPSSPDADASPADTSAQYGNSGAHPDYTPEWGEEPQQQGLALSYQAWHHCTTMLAPASLL